MNVWMYECMNTWMYKSLHIWMLEHMNAWIDDLWIYECLNVGIYECLNVCTPVYQCLVSMIKCMTFVHSFISVSGINEGRECVLLWWPGSVCLGWAGKPLAQIRKTVWTLWVWFVNSSFSL